MTCRSAASLFVMLAALALPAGAGAQEAVSSIDESVAQQPQTQGPMTLERVYSGWAITPDYRVTDFDHTTGQLFGAYGGWVYDNTILFGAGGYWMTNGSHGRDLQYGGAVVEWLQHADRPFGFSVRGLVGWGTSELPGTITRVVQPAPRFDRDGRRIVSPPGTPTIVPVIFHDDFFVFEPQASALIRLTRLMRVNVGVGYRITGGAEGGLDDRLRGVSGSVGLQIGGISK